MDNKHMELNILLVKPDGYRSKDIRFLIYTLIHAAGLKEISRYVVNLRKADVLDIWPKFSSVKYPISRELSYLYMTGGLSEVIIVESADVEGRCDSVKKEVRRRYGAGMFCNSIHTPSGDVEIKSAVEKFVVCMQSGEPFLRHVDFGETPGIWGRLAGASLCQLRETAETIWKLKDVGGWEAIKRTRKPGAYVAYLLSGDPHSIDYGMSVLCDVMPEWGLEETFCTYLEADVFGRAPIAAGDYSAMQQLSNDLVRRGLFAEICAAAH